MPSAALFYYKMLTVHKLQNIHQNGKAENKHKPDRMYNCLYPPRHGLAEYPLDKAENYLASVQRGNGQKIKHRQIDPYICRDIEKALQALRSQLRGQLYRSHRPTDGRKA